MISNVLSIWGLSWFFSTNNVNFFSEISVNDLIIWLSNSSILISDKKLSSPSWSLESFFKISEHLFVCDKSNSTSFLCFEFFPISFSNSLAITVIVDKGVPNEWAAAAACNPMDSSSCSLAKINSSLFKASVLFLDSIPNLTPK